MDKIIVWDTSTQLKEENLMKEKREEMLRVKEIVLLTMDTLHLRLVKAQMLLPQNDESSWLVAITSCYSNCN